MVIRYRGEETEVPMDSPGRAKAFDVLMNYGRLEYPPFDGLAKSVGKYRAALCYSFRLVEMVRFLTALRHGVGVTEQYPNGEARDIVWRPDEVRSANSGALCRCW
jgi:hypothetical protein